jgi:hypothetical protein
MYTLYMTKKTDKSDELITKKTPKEGGFGSVGHQASKGIWWMPMARRGEEGRDRLR